MNIFCNTVTELTTTVTELTTTVTRAIAPITTIPLITIILKEWECINSRIMCVSVIIVWRVLRFQ